MTGSKNQEAIMYMPTEPKLLEYAYRVKQDVQFEGDVVKFEKMKASDEDNIGGKDVSALTLGNQQKIIPTIKVDLNGFDDVIEQPEYYGISKEVKEHFLTSAYERAVNISGRFQQEAIALGLSKLR